MAAWKGAKLLGAKRALLKQKERVRRDPGAILDPIFVGMVHMPFTQPAFLLKYSPRHHYSYTASKSIAEDHRALSYYARQKWAARTDPLWSTFVSTNFTVANLRVGKTVKTWLSRRLKVAYAASMAESGYAMDGTRFEGTQAVRDVYGTVFFMPKDSMLLMKSDEIRVQMDQAVHMIINLSNGQPAHEVSRYEQPLKVKQRLPVPVPKPKLPRRQQMIKQLDLNGISQDSQG